MGADVSAQTKLGHTALRITSAEGHEKTVRVVVKMGADVHTSTADGPMQVHRYIRLLSKVTPKQ
jgi:ankyrin repeat protein